ncbi:cell division protein FtsQ/DivIB [Indiicoccus explosivorum]|uniref:cell division protein FtsQ/DivIB n=1 Tax=Indiicoccus explosivorum TaxID=1917864 RepID=UPI000B447DFC|nr:FtsQ-type POTRA domain-containing protein [Indiicoccus explosivorum]
MTPDKVIDIEERIPKLRDRRKKRTNRKFAGLLVILLILLILLVYNQSPYSKIRSISIEGENLFGEEVYLEASGLTEGESMWSFDPEDVQEKLTELDWVKQAEVERNWLTAVELSVEEFSHVGLLEQESGYQLLLANGYAADLPTEGKTGPLLTGFKEKKAKERIAGQLAKLDQEVFPLISQVIQTSPEEKPAAVTLYMNDGNEVHVLMGSLAEKVNYYPEIAAQLPEGEKGIIDAEVGIFFQPYAIPGEEQTEAQQMEGTGTGG